MEDACHAVSADVSFAGRPSWIALPDLLEAVNRPTMRSCINAMVLRSYLVALKRLNLCLDVYTYWFRRLLPKSYVHLDNVSS
jgi:hypothetical protein